MELTTESQEHEAEREELQKIWDKALISAWRHDKKIGSVFNLFCKDVGIDPYSIDVKEIPDFLRGLGLKRWECATNGGIYLGHLVRPFIAQRCSQMMNCLMNGGEGNSDEEILAAMDHFKWRKIKVKGGFRPPAPKGGARMKLYVRNRDNRRDWNTVK